MQIRPQPLVVARAPTRGRRGRPPAAASLPERARQRDAEQRPHPPANDPTRSLSAPTVTRDERDAYAETARRLPTSRSAVLCSLDHDGTPSLRRVRPTADPAQRAFHLTDAAEPLSAGPASLLCHGHDDKLWNLRSMVTVGRLEPQDGGWSFLPWRFVPGAGTEPLTLLRMIRQNRRTARAHLERRPQSRPRIPWHEYAAVKRAAAADAHR
jgi:hypothetical protein